MQIKSQVTQTIFKRKKEFANYYATDLELGNLEQCNTRIQLISASIDHIINHLTIPHLVANKIVKQDFFLHLATDLRQAIPELADDNLTLSIGGGVIRSLIAYLYKYIHNKKLSTSLSTDDILTKFSSKKK